MLTTRDPEQLIGAAMRVIQGGTAPASSEELEFHLDAAIEMHDQVKVYELVPQIAQLSITELSVIRARLQAAFGRDFSKRDFDKAVKDAQASAKKRARGPLPEIRISNRQIRDIARDGLVALQRGNDPPALFVRSGEMVYVATDELGRPSIKSVNETHLRGRLDRTANYLKITMSGDNPCSPSIDVAKDILSLPSGQWGLPPLVGVVEAPTLRPDGTVLDKPGHDPESHMFYQPAAGLEVLPVPNNPDRDDVQAAVTFIDEAIGEFPYADSASRANVYGLLLTPIVRPAHRGCTPIALIDAPKAGTGKSLLVDAVSTISTGRPAAMTPFPRNDEEMQKQILASLISGRPLICFDNLEGTLSSPALALVLTAKEYESRVLGASENISLPNTATWVVTGNNIRPAGDMPRRCYHIRLDAKMSNPFRGRTFKHPNLLQWANENRGRLLHALLVMARAWYAAGCPRKVKDPLGSFEGWHVTVGSILAFCGVEGLLGNLEQFLDEADEGARQWEGFLLTVADHYPRGAPFTAADLAERVKHSEPLQKALPDSLAEAYDKKPGSLQRYIGQHFSKRRDLRFGELGVYLKRGSDENKKCVYNWRVIVPQIDGEQ